MPALFTLTDLVQGIPWLQHMDKESVIQNFDVHFHWNANVSTLMKFSSLAALEVVILSTSSTGSDENDDIFASVFTVHLNHQLFRQ